MPEQNPKLIWLDSEGNPISCIEKILVLGENLAELEAMAQEAIDDAVLMGADPHQVRSEFSKVIQHLTPRFSNK